jgi:hypothetical protein
MILTIVAGRKLTKTHSFELISVYRNELWPVEKTDFHYFCGCKTLQTVVREKIGLGKTFP